MRLMKRLALIALVLSMFLLLSACTAGADRYQLEKFMGKSVSSFERRTGTELTKQSNGVYVMDGVVQVLAPKKKVTSITLLDKAGKYTIFGIGIGMTKETVEGLLKDTFGKEISNTENTDKNIVTYSYLKDEKQLYVSYDKDKETVTELSYYKISAEDQAAVTEEESSDAGQLMLMVGDTKVYYNEAMVYLKSAQADYEANYSSSIWSADILGNGEDFGKMIKDEVINQITELKIIRAEAGKKGITLTEEEQAEAASYAEEHYNSLTDSDKEQYLITKELLQQVYEDNLLATKMFENLTINVNTEVTDEEAKQITVQDIYIQNFNLDAEGKKVALSEEDKQAAYQKVKSLLEQAKSTDDFKSLAEANSESETIEYTFGKGEGPKDYGDLFESTALSLKKGQVSDIVKTDTGWHILYCVSDFNEDATTQVKENIIDERRDTMFQELYQKWSADYDVVVNNEAWDAIPLGD